MIRRKTILETAILALLLVVLWASPAPAAGPGLVRDVVVSLLRELGLIDATNAPIPPPHNELSATHTDTVAAPPVRGDLIVANSTPKWARFPTGGPATVLSGGTDPSWTATPTLSTLTLTSGLVLTGTTVTGTPTWSSNQAITLSTAAQPNVTSLGTLTGLGLTSGAALSWNSDTVLVRDAANDLALRNGANAQKLSVYNTYTSATNFESFDLDWSGTVNVFNLHSSYGTAGGSPRQWVLGGYALPTDAATMSQIVQAQSAYPQAAVNTSGSNLLAYGGIGRRFWTFVTFGNVQAGSNTFTTTVNYTSVVLTASVDFQSITSNAVAAANLAAAINGNGTLSAQVTATAVASSVYLTKKATCYQIAVTTNAAGGDATSTSGSNGQVQCGSLIVGASAPFSSNLESGLAAPALEIVGDFTANSGTPQVDLAPNLRLLAFGGGTSNGNFQCITANGTPSVPTANALDDQLASFGGRGFTGSVPTTSTQMNIRCSEAQSGTNQGTYFLFQTTATGATGSLFRLRLDTDLVLSTTNSPGLVWTSGGLTGSITKDTGINRAAAGVTCATLGTGTSATGEFSAALYRSAVHASSTGTTTIDTTATFWPCDSTTAAFTITLPTAASVSGRVYVVKKTDASANAVTVGTTSAQTIDGSTTYSLTIRYQTVSVISDGSNWHIYP